MAGDFTLDGLTFRGINGGPEHAGFTETISFSRHLRATRPRSTTTGPRSPRTAARSRCAAGSRTGSGCRGRSCPKRLYELMEDPDPARATAATEAMLRMRKIVVAELEAAADAVAAPARARVTSDTDRYPRVRR